MLCKAKVLTFGSRGCGSRHSTAKRKALIQWTFLLLYICVEIIPLRADRNHNVDYFMPLHNFKMKFCRVGCGGANPNPHHTFPDGDVSSLPKPRAATTRTRLRDVTSTYMISYDTISYLNSLSFNEHTTSGSMVYFRSLTAPHRFKPQIHYNVCEDYFYIKTNPFMSPLSLNSVSGYK